MKKYIKLPTNYRVEKLVYNQVAKTLCVQVGLTFSKLYTSRIYSRHIREEQYHEIEYPFKSNYSYVSLITSIKSSKIYFNVWEHIKRDETTVAANWVELVSFDLITKKSEKILDVNSFIFKNNEKRIWIHDLFGLTSDENGIFCCVVFEYHMENRGYIDYYLCQLTIKNQKIKKLALLKDIF